MLLTGGMLVGLLVTLLLEKAPAGIPPPQPPPAPADEEPLAAPLILDPPCRGPVSGSGRTRPTARPLRGAPATKAPAVPSPSRAAAGRSRTSYSTPANPR
ncbi:hypothetical protein LT493_44090 [Streptomyces tricolor]|nr:hypothetical protein [Streptomyces tricolor]